MRKGREVWGGDRGPFSEMLGGGSASLLGVLRGWGGRAATEPELRRGSRSLQARPGTLPSPGFTRVGSTVFRGARPLSPPPHRRPVWEGPPAAQSGASLSLPPPPPRRPLKKILGKWRGKRREGGEFPRGRVFAPGHGVGLFPRKAVSRETQRDERVN